MTGIAPNALFGAPIFVELAHDYDERLSLSLGARFERTGGTSTGASGGAAFTWTVGALDVCPLVVSTPWRRPLRLRPCLRLEAGAIDATGVDVTPARSATRAWLDLGIALAARWRFAGPVFVELEGALAVPLVRDRFFLEPNQTVFQAPWVGVHAGGGLGVEIW